MIPEDKKAKQAERARELNEEIERLVKPGKSGDAAGSRTPRGLAEEGAAKARKQEERSKTKP